MAIIVLVFLLFIGSHANKILRSHNDVLLHESDSAFNVAKTYIDKNGDLTTQVATYEVTLKQLTESNIIKDVNLERLKKQIGDLNNLVVYFKGQAAFKGEVFVQFKDSSKIVFKKDSIGFIRTDTVDFKNFSWSNGHLTINEDYYPYDNAVVLEYQYDLGGFEITAYRKKLPREKWYKKREKQLVADIKFGDPNIEVSKFQSVVIKEEPKKVWQKWWFWLLAGGIGGMAID